MMKKIYEDVLDDIEKIEPDVSLTEPEDDAWPILREEYAYSIIVNCHMMYPDEWKRVPDILRGYLDAYADGYRITGVSFAEDVEELHREIENASNFVPRIIVQFNVQKVFLICLLFLILSTGTHFQQAIRVSSAGQARYFLQGPFITDARYIVQKDFDIGEERIWELATVISILAANRKYSETDNFEQCPEWTEAYKVVKDACRRASARKALREKR